MTFDLTPEQLRRAQINGGLKRRPAKMRYTRAHIIELLQKRGPLIALEISEFINKKPNTLLVLIKNMVLDQQIVIIGQAGQLARQIGVSTRRNANVYAVPGTPMLESLATLAASRALPSSAPGEKNLAPRREIPEFRPLHRDPFAHQRLAMLARR